jgi:hypothetical protein
LRQRLDHKVIFSVSVPLSLTVNQKLPIDISIGSKLSDEQSTLLRLKVQLIAAEIIKTTVSNVEVSILPLIAQEMFCQIQGWYARLRLQIK